MITDLRQAFRSIVKSPGFSAVVILVLAIGIGANTAIFSIVNGVMLKPLPYADASRLVSVITTLRGEDDDSASFPDFVDWRAQSKTMDGMAAYVSTGVTMTGAGDAASLDAAVTTADLFTMLGVKPLVGRTLAAADDVKGAPLVAVISETAWEHYFGRRSSIVGESVTLDSTPVTIVGVMPANFQFPIQADRLQAWLPFAAVRLMAQWQEQRGAHYVQVLGHLAPGATADAANAELKTIAAGLATAYPKSNANRSARVEPLQVRLVHEYRLGLVVLLGAVGAVLLIACANVANLLLARGTSRQKEMAVRAAMGASRVRLVRQLLTESIVLAAAGGVVGALFSLWAVAALVSASPLEIPRLHDVAVDRTVLFFATLISMATGVLFGVVPALHMSRADGGDTLKDASRGSSGRSARTRQTLVVAEVALSLVLLAGAGLLVRSLVALQNVDPGFIAEHAVTTQLTLPSVRYPDSASQLAFYDRLLAEMAAIPGVSSSAVSTTMPMSGNDLGIGFTIEGRPVDPGNRQSATYFGISPDYFKAMGIRVIRGRGFTAADTKDSPNVIVISDTFARRYWPNDDAIGKRITIGYNNPGPREIVGIVGDVKNTELSEKARPAMYTAFPQTPWPFLAVVVRTTGDPSAVIGSLRAAVSRLDPNQAVTKVDTVTQYVANAVSTPRFVTSLVGAFASVALLLAGFGLFSVMAYSVAQRRREIGIRMALGAQAADVWTLVVSQAVRLGIIGLIVGLAGAFAATRVLDSLLFGVTATDPATFVAVSATLLVVLLLAAYLPARRATRIDPMIALRTE